MPHLHLSMQAGDDMILKRMKRRHSRADAVKFCSDVRRCGPTLFSAPISLADSLPRLTRCSRTPRSSMIAS